MLEEELLELVNKVVKQKYESRTIELKKASGGCPRLYETLSSFANQSSGGIILFGIDNDFNVCGVYDAQDLQQKIADQCKQMEPIIRPIISMCTIDGKTVVSAEIPAKDIFERPCFYKGVGVLNGSYVRVGDADEPMSEYEIYSYDAYKHHKQDDLRQSSQESKKYLDETLIQNYLNNVKIDKPNTQSLSDDEILELMGVTKNGLPTISAVMCFSKYPQAFYPQLCITAVVVPGTNIGQMDENNSRFLDNKKIEGTIPEMLERAVNFIVHNIRTTITFEQEKRIDRPEYPILAIREAVLNALVHRDYSIHTEGTPIRIEIYNDRLEISNAGGLYGSIDIDDLGRLHADTRNKALISILETLKVVENRHSGIPTMKAQMEKIGLQPPVFSSTRGFFKVVFYNSKTQSAEGTIEEKILKYCFIPRTQNEIAEYLGKTSYYIKKNYIEPLVAKGLLDTTIKEKTQSKFQKYVKK